MKTTIAERLVNFHNNPIEEDEHENQEDSFLLNKSKPFKVRHSAGFILRFSIIFIIAIGMYLVAILYFYDQIQSLLSLRPTFIYTSVIISTSINQLCFWSYECDIINQHYSLSSMYPYSNILKDPYTGVYDSISTINTHYSIFVKRNIMSLYSTDVYEYLFHYTNSSSSKILEFGTYTAEKYLMYEAFNIIDNSDVESYDNIQNYYLDTSAASDSFQTLNVMANNSSENVIKTAIDNYLYYITAFCGFLLLMLVFYYYPLLKYEENVLKNTKSLMKIIPKTNVK